MARIYDNIELKFDEGLKNVMNNPGIKRVDFCVGYFNLRGWNLIVNEIDQLPGDFIYEGDERRLRCCRLLIGMNQTPEELIRMRYGRNDFIPDANFAQKYKRRMAMDFRRQLTLGVPTKMDEHNLRRLLAQLQEGKVCVKLYLREPLHAKLYLAHRPYDYSNKIIAIMGSSNLTYNGMTKQGELNAEFADSDHAQKFDKWFEDRWNDRWCVDITDELKDILTESWVNDSITPYDIYLKTVYHLCQDVRTGLNEYELPVEFRKDLFPFQETAVKIAARHLHNEKRGGAMIGDVVGLGKTITACAITKLYEMNYAAKTLIICPANLQEMWKRYVDKYDLKADIMSMQKPIDVDSTRLTYRLVVIDESHNLRNGGKRYQNIKNLIEHADCKVLLLTATPYNKDYKDLSNQIRLFVPEDADLGIRPEAYIQSLGGDRAFQLKHSDIFIRSLQAFEHSTYEEDWRELMKLFLVRRTRTFIKEYYAETDESNGRKYLQFRDGHRSYFPTRHPQSIKFKTASNDQYSRLYSDKMLDVMKELRLPRYGLALYVDTKQPQSQSETKIIENLTKAGQRLMGFCKSTFFKRMDSCGFSFLLTLYRHVLRNMIYLYAIENKLPLPIGDEGCIPDDFYEDADTNGLFVEDSESKMSISSCKIHIPHDQSEYKQKAQDYYNAISLKSGITWLDSKFFKPSLKKHLKEDTQLILNMIEYCGDWNAATDEKLNELENLLTTKHANEKVLVFTQYSDTARYIYEQLAQRGIKQLAYVSGDTQNVTSVVERFSPKSNGKEDVNDELRVMIATDVLSEGQNLQDAHIIVNFDLPWAIIRLIQRAGRVDRIGQTSEDIYCYSFFPADGIENLIRLRNRLNARINANAGLVGSDEVFFEGNEQNLRDLYNEKNGSLDEQDDSDVDLASQAYQIWESAIKANPALKTKIPNIPDVAYSTKKNDMAAIQEGVITYAKTMAGNDMLTWLDKHGQVISSSQNYILKAMACAIDTPSESPLDNHLELVSKAITGMQAQDARVIGVLGSRFSVKYFIATLLETFITDNPLFASDELKEALDNIYNYPLKEGARFLIGQMKRRNILRDDIIEQILDLHRRGDLCHIDENNDNDSQEPTIICSMGLKNC